MSLSNEDKAWFLAQLAGVEVRISEWIERVETRIEGVEARMSERIEAVEARMSERIEGVEARMRDRIERVETSLLTEFHKWAGPVEMRQHSHSAALRALDLEMEAMGERVTKLEKPQ